MYSYSYLLSVMYYYPMLAYYMCSYFAQFISLLVTCQPNVDLASTVVNLADHATVRLNVLYQIVVYLRKHATSQCRELVKQS